MSTLPGFNHQMVLKNDTPLFLGPYEYIKPYKEWLKVSREMLGSSVQLVFGRVVLLAEG
jgi:hypothetical protein